DFTENGNFEIKSVLSDEEFEEETIWNVSVNISGIGDDSLIPQVTKLVGNYPNPFNPTTTIKYDLKETSFVQIGIFNIKGQKINSLVNQSENAGSKSIAWNGTDSLNNKVGSGLYFYRMIINGKVHSMKKCIMLK
ncbi:MAG: T9SS type A sorting domain-containing protein, partial [Candidatus Cloacimonadota bacterium]|nr:T9SS type A sorting domain-containing protein [Candidatus Cloacimonadota bacterium]